jgi:hypothetical protein
MKRQRDRHFVIIGVEQYGQASAWRSRLDVFLVKVLLPRICLPAESERDKRIRHYDSNGNIVDLRWQLRLERARLIDINDYGRLRINESRGC